MADESLQDRTEDASGKRRDDFRKKGQVAQSKEVNTAVLLTTSLLFWFFYAPHFWNSLQEIMIFLFRLVGHFPVTSVSIFQLITILLQKTGILLAPVFFLSIVAGFLSSFIQFGWVFSMQPLTPKFSKMNPISGMKRFFSKRSLVEMLKSLLKVILVAYVSYVTIKGGFDEALSLIDMVPLETVRYTARVAGQVLFRVCGILMLLALLDYSFVRWELEEQMKMTKQEKKEEAKDMDGDPQIKSRIRSLQRQMARRRMLAEVPKADVIITNPTHIAVAIIYKRGEMEAPTIVAKGADHLAMRIREIARENGVPIIENPPVARLLHKVDIGNVIPQELFKAVAEILAYVYSIKGGKKTPAPAR